MNTASGRTHAEAITSRFRKRDGDAKWVERAAALPKERIEQPTLHAVGLTVPVNPFYPAGFPDQPADVHRAKAAQQNPRQHASRASHAPSPYPLTVTQRPDGLARRSLVCEGARHRSSYECAGPALTLFAEAPIVSRAKCASTAFGVSAWVLAAGPVPNIQRRFRRETVNPSSRSSTTYGPSR